jgi:hypothetical protein
MKIRKNTRRIAAVAAVVAIAGGTYGIVGATAGNGSPAQTVPRAGGSNARSGPAAGGTTGTVVTVSASRFTLSTPAGQKVTVTKVPSMTSIKKGVHVLVLGTVDGTTITARQVIVQPAAKSSATAGVVPFRQGAPSASKQVGQIPATYTQGAGTIVSGTAAAKATTAALASYPGGIVDRVVKLSNGEYEVHNIGVNWPHHIFVTKSFKVAGAD